MLKLAPFIFVSLVITVVAGCRTPLTPAGREIVAFKSPGELPQGCKKGPTYVAQSRFGATKALNSIRNKVAAENSGDTLLISSVEYGRAPGAKRITVIAFTCGKWWEANQKQQTIAEKCAAKGGSVVDGQCVLQLE